MTVFRLQDVTQAVDTVLASRTQQHEDVFVYVDGELLYAFYHQQQTEVITTSHWRGYLIQALHASL